MTAAGSPPVAAGLRKAVIVVALLNFVYGVIEFGVGLIIGSVALFADSLDFFEDASVNLLIFFALVWSSKQRARIGMLLALVLVLPALAGLWTAAQKLATPVPPDALSLGLTGLGALLVNLFCALLLSAYRSHRGSLTRAAFLSARNDALANLAIIAAGFVTAYLWRSAWPDIIVGVGIALMNADAARAVFKAAWDEHAAVS